MRLMTNKEIRDGSSVTALHENDERSDASLVPSEEAKCGKMNMSEVYWDEII